MLGLSDRGAVRALLGLLLAGDAPGALAALKDQYELGVEPPALLRSLLEAVHGITRVKVGGGARDPAQSEEEREAYADLAARLSFPVLHRLWQLLLKGLDEVARAPLPLEAAEMALLRVIHASQLPDPGELAASLASGRPAPPPRPRQLRQLPPPRRPARSRRRRTSPLWWSCSNGAMRIWRSSCTISPAWSAYAPPELALKLAGRCRLARDLSRR
jgi:DNA polymerase-3 subunit gamma/tau